MWNALLRGYWSMPEHVDAEVTIQDAGKSDSQGSN